MTHRPSYAKAIAAIHAGVTDIQANLAYIERELPPLRGDFELKKDIIDICQGFWTALCDIRKEVYNLEHALSIDPPDDALSAWDSIKSKILQTLSKETNMMDGLIRTLWVLVEEDDRIGVVSLLVTESAENILKNVPKIDQALGEIENRLD